MFWTVANPELMSPGNIIAKVKKIKFNIHSKIITFYIVELYVDRSGQAQGHRTPGPLVVMVI
jgi:hypothetical protein